MIALPAELAAWGLGGPVGRVAGAVVSGRVVGGALSDGYRASEIRSQQISRTESIHDAANGYPYPPGSIPGSLARVSETVRVARIGYLNDVRRAEDAKNHSQDLYASQRELCEDPEEEITRQREERVGQLIVDCIRGLDQQISP